LLDALVRSARSRGCAVVEVVPQFVAALNQYRRLRRPGAWFGLVHGGVLSLAAFDGASIAAVRTCLIPPGADRDWPEGHVARAPRPALALCIMSLCLAPSLIGTTIQYRKLLREQESVQARVAAAAAPRASAPPPARAPVPEAQANAVNAAVLQLNLPWRALQD